MRYEYMILTPADVRGNQPGLDLGLLLTQMNEFGKDGWAFAAITPTKNPNDFSVILQRQIPM